ncbi:hypothetical protein HMSSN036_80980 [Paenibacillus macerans]|nr:hypothetical protein HMSSN036_80980 [Paenibacillus macerans]
MRGSGYVLEGGDRPAIQRAAEEAGASEQALAVQVFRLMIDLPGYVTMENIGERFYISKSKLNGVLGNMKEQMKPFGLELKAKPHHGMKIAGEELGKGWRSLRSCASNSICGRVNFKPSNRS